MLRALETAPEHCRSFLAIAGLNPAIHLLRNYFAW
jgi:hypothetical protein